LLTAKVKTRTRALHQKGSTDMKVAIIGTGNVGKALGSSLARAGHDVTYAAQDEAKARAVAGEVGGRAESSLETAVAGAQVVVLAVPFSAMEDVTSRIAGAVADKVVIDATNPLRPDYSGLATGDGPSGAERIAALLPGASVAKAFNTLFAGIQADPGTLETTIDALFATDDDAAAATVADLAESIGFRPVRVGPLAAARELEAMAWLNIRLQMLNRGSWQTSFVLVAPPDAAIAA
jgi:8-hydroxy-5-deazaflavin:NADPH oxidoreductase